MFRRWRLRTRLIAAYAGLILLGFAGLSLLAGKQIAAGAVEDYERSLATQAALVGRNLEELVEHYLENEASLAEMETVVSELARELEVEVSLLDRDGLVWVSSAAGAATSSLASAPEVTAVIEGRASVVTVRPDAQNVSTIYTAVPITHDDELLSIVRVAVPESVTVTVIYQRYVALAAGVLGLTVLAFVAALWLSTSFTRPLEALQQSAMRLAAGDLSQRVTVTRQDEFGQLGETFNHMAAQVEAMLLEQKAFASNASHELRTPLTTIRLRSEALRDGTVDEATAEQYIAEIDDEVVRLGRLVNDLIQLSRFDAGRAEMGNALLEPVRMGRSIYRQMQETAVAKNITLQFDAPDQLPLIRANQSHLLIVLQNLLDNALKYTPAGGQVRWQMSVEDGYLRSEMRDSGVGLAPDEIPHLFERFYRADKAHGRTTGGSGLGLPLAQSIVQFYNGCIQLHSAGLGQGSTAIVWWPLPTTTE